MNTRILSRYQPSAFLLAAQLISLVLYSVFDGDASKRALLGVFGVIVLAFVVWVIRRTPTFRWIVWLLVTPAIVLSILSVIFPLPALVVLSSILEAGLYFYAAGGLIAYMMGDYRVTADELFAAGATFTLLAWGFAYVYMIFEIWSPGSFVGATFPAQRPTFLGFLFLSFTNLSATGLGDIIPVTAPARVVVMLEQFSGIAYLAVVVSRLIGMTLARHRDGKSR